MLVAFVGWAFLHPAPPPYGYRLVAEGGAKEFPDLGLEPSPDLAIQEYEVHVEGVGRPVASLHLARRPSGDAVLLDWHNDTAEPVLRLEPSLAETRALAEAIAEYVPAGSPVLAWWNTSRRLRLLAGTEVLFDENLARPLLVPSAWRGKRDAILAIERSFWHLSSAPRTEQRFDRFVDALLLDEASGLARLRELAGGREAYLVVHLLDAYKLGAMRPDRFGIGYKDFPASQQLHGLVKHVKGWLAEHGYESYAVMPIAGSEGVTRVFFLTDPADSDTLMARMLPFSTSNPFAIEGLRIVYQHGGYWVYRLPAEAAES